MRIISWNVNGINACLKKGLLDFMRKENADVYCFQEVKASKTKLPRLDLNNYWDFHLFSEKNGYSGVSIYSKLKPLSIIEGISNKEFDKEARVLALEFNDFFLINAYFPHSNRELSRLDFKLKFNKTFLEFCKKLENKKPIIIASDFNVAHKEVDLRNPKQNEKNAGFTKDEREWFDNFLNEGFVDTFREFVKDGGNYTWWTYRNNARERNIGWRIDYFIVSKILKNKLKDSQILKNTFGSDHCPIFLEVG